MDRFTNNPQRAEFARRLQDIANGLVQGATEFLETAAETKPPQTEPSYSERNERLRAQQSPGRIVINRENIEGMKFEINGKPFEVQAWESSSRVGHPSEFTLELVEELK